MFLKEIFFLRNDFYKKLIKILSLCKQVLVYKKNLLIKKDYYDVKKKEEINKLNINASNKCMRVNKTWKNYH